MKKIILAGVLGLSLALAACGNNSSEPSDDGERISFDKDPYPSTYVPAPSGTLFITGATVIDGIGGKIENGSVIVTDGRITAVGARPAEDAKVRTVPGKFIGEIAVDIPVEQRQGRHQYRLNRRLQGIQVHPGPIQFLGATAIIATRSKYVDVGTVANRFLHVQLLAFEKHLKR